MTVRTTLNMNILEIFEIYFIWFVTSDLSFRIMSADLFNILWFIVFMLVILIAFIANIIIILAILRDKSMHTSTYFYIINVNIADIILLLSCLPERIAAVFRSNDGFQLGMFTCKFKRMFFLSRVCHWMVNKIVLDELFTSSHKENLFS
jgi:hypothetical protein